MRKNRAPASRYDTPPDYDRQLARREFVALVMRVTGGVLAVTGTLGAGLAWWGFASPVATAWCVVGVLVGLQLLVFGRLR